jgi:hypothetical protein
MLIALCAAAPGAQAQSNANSNHHIRGLESHSLGPAGHGGLQSGRRGGTGGLSTGRVGGTGGLQGYNTTRNDDLGTPDSPNVYTPPYKRPVP